MCVCVCLPPTWSLHAPRLHRMTSMEREEKEKVKKREKKLEDEETMQQATWVKYTFPIKHQVPRHVSLTHASANIRAHISFRPRLSSRGNRALYL